jgi:hypothetical protein
LLIRDVEISPQVHSKSHLKRIVEKTQPTTRMSQPDPAGQQRQPGSVLELMEFVLPTVNLDRCPDWPPDLFAIVATVLRRNGAYVRCVATGVSESASDRALFDEMWPDRARSVGERWRNVISAAQAEYAGTGKLSAADALKQATIPDEVQAAWSRLYREAEKTPLADSADNDELTRALLELNGYSDEASYGIGLGALGGADDGYGQAARLFLQLNGKQSFCHWVDRQKARVLGKKHTPQQGLTLRSLTHNLSLCMPWEVEPLWYDLDAPRLDDVLNLLLLPWPLKVNAREFRRIEVAAGQSTPREHCLFEYRREPAPAGELSRRVNAAIDQAYQCVTRLHAIVLPELAMTCEEWKVVEKIALQRRVMLISGIIDDVGDVNNVPINSCRIQMMALTSSDEEVSPSVIESPPPAYRQTKHHRWCLDRNQVLQYDLGGQLPTALRCWENSHIHRRRIFFAQLGGWLTFSVLICEDLARQDPIADVLRSVGPNLVVALLMDGPQLAARWSARYASVLADDPGTSVLTLTSLGMSERSRQASTGENGSRVIALWKDKLYGTREIELAMGSCGCVLSLARERREEFTADGRSDGTSTEVPVFAGVFQVEEVAS